MTEVRKRKKGKKAEGTNGKVQSYESFTTQLDALTAAVISEKDNSELLSKYETLLQDELKKRRPGFKCHLWSLVKIALKALWIMVLLLVAAGFAIYYVESLNQAFSLYIQQNMYPILRAFRIISMSISPIIPQINRPCLVLNPFSPAYTCGCMSGLTISNTSFSKLPSSEYEFLVQNGFVQLPQSGIGMLDIRSEYLKGSIRPESCGDFGGEEDVDGQVDKFFWELMEEESKVEGYLKSNKTWKMAWHECEDGENSVLDLLPELKVFPGYVVHRNPVMFIGRQWSRYVHIPDNWNAEGGSWLLMVVLKGKLRITIDPSYDCAEFCMMHRNINLDAGDAVLFHEKHWSTSGQVWDRSQTVLMTTALKTEDSV